jgi:TatD DNase family protein
MKLEYIDTHAHLDFDDYKEDFENVIQRTIDNKVGVITIGTDLEKSKKALEIAEKYDHIWAVIGFHPLNVEDVSREDFKELEKLLKHPKCVGVGECGLDYSKPEVAPPDSESLKIKLDSENIKKGGATFGFSKQKEFFIRQIGLAIDYKKPVIIHCRDAWDETLEILKVYKETNPELRVNFHFFNQDKKRAKEILDSGFQYSFTGIITFVKELEGRVREAPLDKLMSETDSPFVAPKSKRGKRNEPSYVIEIVEKIAELKELSIEDVKKQLLKNAKEFFDLTF